MTTTISTRVKRGCCGLAAAFLLLTSLAAQAAVTQPFTADFKISHSGIPMGTATFRLKPDGHGCYVYSGHAQPNFIAHFLVGAISEKARFCIDHGVLRPQRFVYHIDGKPKKSYTLNFNWAAHQAIYHSEKGKRKTLTLGARAYDPLSIQIVARHWLAQAKAPATLADTRLPLVDKDKIKNYRLHVTDGGPIQTPGGTFDTLRVAGGGDSDHPLKLWLARDANWIPVRVVQAGDNAYRMDLTKLSP
jgi:hypothetical protein